MRGLAAIRRARRAAGTRSRRRRVIGTLAALTLAGLALSACTRSPVGPYVQFETNTSVLVDWDPIPPDNTFCDVVGYVVRMGTDPSQLSAVDPTTAADGQTITTGPQDGQIEVDNLALGTTYYFQVATVGNWSGLPCQTSPMPAVPYTTPPSPSSATGCQLPKALTLTGTDVKTVPGTGGNADVLSKPVTVSTGPLYDCGQEYMLDVSSSGGDFFQDCDWGGPSGITVDVSQYTAVGDRISVAFQVAPNACTIAKAPV